MHAAVMGWMLGVGGGEGERERAREREREDKSPAECPRVFFR